MTEVLIIIVLTLINAYFVMAETALISAKRSKLESMSSKGDSKASIALWLKNDPDLFLSTVQIFITLVTIITGMYSGEKLGRHLVPYLEDIGVSPDISISLAIVIVVSLVTFFSILIGELIPKRLAIMYPDTIAKTVARSLKVLSKASYPIVWLLSKINTGFFNLLSLKPSDENLITEEEIKAMINEGSEVGTIEEEEKDIIERVFHLGDRSITSLMTYRTEIVWFERNESLASCRAKIEEFYHSMYPVCKENIDNIEGVVHVKDIYLHPNKSLVQLMRKPLFVPENNSAYQVLEKIKNSRLHYAFVIDEYGSLQGMITARDILSAIVGEMPEEDEDEYEIIKRRDGSYLVDGQTQFYDFLDYFEKTSWIEDEEQQEFDTLAGFIINELEKIPVNGDVLDWRGFHFEIAEMDGQRVDKVKVEISDKIRADLEDDV